jgi:hypothetical protein
MNFNEYFEYCNGELYWKKTTSFRIKVGQKAGYKRKDGYSFVRLNKKHYGVHQIIFAIYYKYIPKEVDHIDNNPSNNCIENLRAATRSQNAINQPLTLKNKSGIKGVSWHKQAKKWIVQLFVNKQYKYLGLYDDIELAELVSIEARNKYHREFANFSRKAELA